MNHKLIIISILLIFFSPILAQNKVDKEYTRYLKTLGKVDLGLSGLGLSLETPVSDQVLLEFAAGLGAGYKVDEDFRYRLYFNDPAVFGSAHMKYYYNQQSRVDRGRPVSYNAGNFFGIKAKYTSPTLWEQQTWHTMLVGFHWGLQRKIGKYFLYQFDVGIGVAVDLENKNSHHITPFPDLNFRISYVLPFGK